MWQNITDQRSCKNASVCAVGFQQTAALTTTSDRVCTQCGDGFFKNNTGQSTNCSAWRVCALGNFQTVVPTFTSDRECAGCLAGTYSNTSNAVSNSSCITCPDLTFQDEVGKSTCRSCNETAICNATQYRDDADCTRTTGSKCKDCHPSCASCSMANNCAVCRDTACFNNQNCPSNIVPIVYHLPNGTCGEDCGAGFFDIDSFCYACQANCATCQQASVCDNCMSGFALYSNSSSITSCLTQCPSGFFARNGVCVAVATCRNVDNRYEAAPPTATTNRICGNISVCARGAFVSANFTATSDRVCTNCSAGTYDSLPDIYDACLVRFHFFPKAIRKDCLCYCW